MSETRALDKPFHCRECGAFLATPGTFHDYVECIRHRLPTLVLGDAQAHRDARSLLAYIDSKEPDRIVKAHPLYHGEAEA